MKKRMGIIIALLIILVIGSIIGFIIGKKGLSHPYKDLYCDNGFCYSYEKETLKKYEKEEEILGYIDWNHFDTICSKEDCKEIVFYQDKELLILKRLHQYYFYFPYDAKEENNNSSLELKGKVYSSGEVEIYFLNTKHILIAGKNHPQQRKEYEILKGNQDYFLIQTDYYQTSKERIPTNYLYNNKTIQDFEEISLGEANYIKPNYYKEDGTIKGIQSYYQEMQGVYHSDNKEIKFNQITIQNQKISSKFRYDSKLDLEDISLEIKDVNDKYIYIWGGTGINDVVYNREKKTLCYIKQDHTEDYEEDYDEEMASVEEHCYDRVS